MSDPMRDYLEKRERDLEARIAGLEAMLCDAQAEVQDCRLALQPFAEAVSHWGDQPDDNTTINGRDGSAWLEGTAITFGDLRRARAVFARLNT